MSYTLILYIVIQSKMFTAKVQVPDQATCMVKLHEVNAQLEQGAVLRIAHAECKAKPEKKPRADSMTMPATTIRGRLLV